MAQSGRKARASGSQGPMTEAENPFLGPGDIRLNLRRLGKESGRRTMDKIRVRLNKTNTGALNSAIEKKNTTK